MTTDPQTPVESAQADTTAGSVAPIDLGEVRELTRGGGPSPQMDLGGYYEVMN